MSKTLSPPKHGATSNLRGIDVARTLIDQAGFEVVDGYTPPKQRRKGQRLLSGLTLDKMRPSVIRVNPLN